MQLRTKISLYTTGLILLVGLVTIYTFISTLQKNLFQTFLNNSFKTQELISRNIADPLYKLDINELRKIAQDSQSLANIVDIVIADHDGLVLAEGNNVVKLELEPLVVFHFAAPVPCTQRISIECFTWVPANLQPNIVQPSSLVQVY